MFYERKFPVMVEIQILLLLLLMQNEVLVNASIKSGKAKVSPQDGKFLKEQSSNQIPLKEERKHKSEDEQLYYLPMQTVFGETQTLAGTGGVSTTSPPHLSINPAPIQTTYQESTSLLYEDSSDNEYFHGSYQCVSETPVIELESRFLLPSSDVIKEQSVIMSGHVEIASKTSSVEEVYHIGSMVSKPSIALQGTLLHSHSISDL